MTTTDAALGLFARVRAVSHVSIRADRRGEPFGMEIEIR
jgi:hypothetical protein